jgi:hypothetical protein
MVKRYQRGNQKPEIKEEQTTQWPKDTKEAIRSQKSKKDRQHNGQKKKDKRRNNDIQNTTQKTKDPATRSH